MSISGQTSEPTGSPESAAGAPDVERPLTRMEREKRRHRWENIGLLLVAIGVAALVFVAIAAGTH
jgi:hypothetical protein